MWVDFMWHTPLTHVIEAFKLPTCKRVGSLHTVRLRVEETPLPLPPFNGVKDPSNDYQWSASVFDTTAIFFQRYVEVEAAAGNKRNNER
jgi:hypothetical protein